MTLPSMDRIQEIYCTALERPSAERLGYVREMCGADHELREEIESLLALDREAEDFLEVPAFALAADPPPNDLELSGRTIGPYRLLEEIGRGGMGTVWLAQRSDEHYERRVALKLIHPGHATESLRRRFQRERQMLAALEHPNIARLYDGGVTSTELPYLVMEYVDGAPIHEYCATHELSTRARVALFVQVCEAVQYAHQNLIIHRDIKPTNVLVDGNGEPKLLDFGIAKVLDETGVPVGEHTATLDRLLTPRYASPEQIAGGPITVSSDVYSLGVLLYELLTERSPYDLDVERRTDLENQVLAGQLPPPSTVVTARDEATRRRWRRQISGDLDTIVLMALRAEPSRRYASADQLAEDLRRHLDGRTVNARPDTWHYRSRKFIRRNWPVVGMISAVVISLAVALVISERAIAELREERKKTEIALGILENALVSVDPDRARTADTTLMRSVLEDAHARIGAERNAAPELVARLRAVIGRTYTNLGEYAKGAEELEEAYRIQRAELGPHDPLTLQSGHWWAAALLKNTQQSEAIELLERLIEDAQIVHGPDALETSSLENNLAEANFELANLDVAQSLFEHVLAKRRRFEPDAPTTAVTAGNLANVFMVRGRYEDARSLFDEALAALPVDHLKRLSILNNYGYLEATCGNIETAEGHYRAALTAREAILGAHHPDTMATRNNLSLLYYRADRLEEATAETERLLALRREHLGEEHDDTVLSWSNLSVLRSHQGRTQEAVEIQRRILALRETKLGLDHPSTLTTLGNLISGLSELGKREEAERLAAIEVERAKGKFGREHAKTLSAKYRLSFLLRKSGRSEAALELMEEVASLAPRVLPENDPDLGYYSVELGRALTAAGQYERAEAEIERGLAELDRTVGRPHRYAQLALRAFVDLYETWQRPDRAEQYRSLLTH